MKRPFLISSLIISLFLTACGQKSQKNDLIGIWRLAKKENAIKSQLSIIPISKKDSEKKENKQEIIIRFNQNSIADFKQGNQNFKTDYSIEGKRLSFGSSEYKILKLDSDSLIMVEENQLMPTTYHYFKSDKEFKTIKEYENIEEKYSNGQQKSKGTYHNGFEDGLWEEWYENGQKKSEKRFKDGIPVGTWKEWNVSGELINERKVE